MTLEQGSQAFLVVKNKRGLHARASSKLAKLAGTFAGTSITVAKGGESVGATSIMGLMMLGAAKGDDVTITTAGPAAEAALQAIVDLFENKFGEGE